MTSRNMNFGQRLRQSHRCVYSGVSLMVMASVLGAGIAGHARAASTGVNGVKVLDQSTGNTSHARAVTADGTLIAGAASFGVAGSAYERAALWTPTGLIFLTSDNGLESRAVDGSSNFDILVGDQQRSAGGSATQAYYWVRATNSFNLLDDWGVDSFANGISDDGALIVGSASVSSSTRAVVWMKDTATQTYDKQLLSVDPVDPTRISMAYQISGDGSTIVGYMQSGPAAPWPIRGAIWTGDFSTGGTLSFIPTAANQSTVANAVSYDGTYIVGHADDEITYVKSAFRYRVGDASIVDLGSLGGEMTSASQISRDGSVVVGTSMDANYDQWGFRWTEATGLQTVEEWLSVNGVSVAGHITKEAFGTSDDGQIIVGRTIDEQAYVARVSSSGSGLITDKDYFSSVGGLRIAERGLRSANVHLNGTEPMRDLLEPGRQAFTIMGDWGNDNVSAYSGNLANGYLRYSVGIEGATLRMIAGPSYANYDLSHGGDLRSNGFFLAPEATFKLADRVYATASAYYGKDDVKLRRGYTNAGKFDYSSADVDRETWGAKLRIDWHNAVETPNWGLTPYGILSYARSEVDAYRENGGGFPARFDARNEHETILRAGLDAVNTVSDGIRILAKAEAAYQFEDKSSPVRGDIIGVKSFELSGADRQQFWLRGGLGIEADVATGSIFANVNATTNGQDPSLWVKTGWRVEF